MPNKMPKEENNSISLRMVLLGIMDIFDKNPELKRAETEKEFEEIVEKGLNF